MKGLLFRYMVWEYMGHDEHAEGHNHARSALGDCLESLTAKRDKAKGLCCYDGLKLWNLKGKAVFCSSCCTIGGSCL
jgi:hypothetical protein